MKKVIKDLEKNIKKQEGLIEAKVNALQYLDEEREQIVKDIEDARILMNGYQKVIDMMKLEHFDDEDFKEEDEDVIPVKPNMHKA